MLDGLLENLLQAKWDAFAKKRFALIKQISQIFAIFKLDKIFDLFCNILYISFHGIYESSVLTDYVGIDGGFDISHSGRD